MGIRENVEKVLKQIEEAALRAGRRPEEVKLLAASKTRNPQEIKEAYEAGVKLFGENRVQEAREKIPQLADLKAQWHMIGHLQTNKVKYAVKLFDCIESVDREGLVEELQKRLSREGKVMPVLIEVKLSPEESKHGCLPQELPRLTEKVLNSPNLKLKGLMTVPPYFEDPEKVRPYFAELRRLRDELQEKFKVELPELSMGMSHDFPVAVEEGATIVRVGTAIFGPRNY
ncbi:YggS family pyridoxal phosphate-dependent enzyme [Thermovibrio ammonificans]